MNSRAAGTALLFVSFTYCLTEEEALWDAEFCCGYWAYRFQSSCSLHCARTTRAGRRMENLTIAQRTTLEDSAVESNASAVSWAAILAGAVVAAATSLVLALVVAGVDLASVSPWPGSGASARSITAVSAIALIIIQWLSAAIGGYLTGRLRTKWTATHSHEVFFRDTANGRWRHCWQLSRSHPVRPHCSVQARVLQVRPQQQ